MKVYILGAGTMGTLFGTTLILGGETDVTFFDTWPVLLEHAKKDPVAHRYTHEGTEEKVPVKVLPFSNSKVDPADLIIVTVKANLTAEVTKHASEMGMIALHTVLVTCQGGIENEDFLAMHTKAPEHVLVGCTSSFGKSRGPLAIENFGIRNTSIWMHGVPADGAPDNTVTSIVEKCNAAGLNFDLTPKSIADKWTMLLYYTANIAVSAIVGRSFGSAWQNTNGKELLTALSIECAEVAEKEGIDQKLFNKEIAVKEAEKLATVSATHGGSMHADLRNKRITEIDATSGALLRKAKKYGLELPYTNAIYLLIKTIEQTYDLQI